MTDVANRAILRGAIIALPATAIGSGVETSQLSGAQNGEGVIVAFRRKPYAVRNGDAYDMVIEYTTPAGTGRFSKSRAIWDMWSPMTKTGTRLPVLYKDDGRAWVDMFFYARPFTGATLVFDGLLAVTWLWLATMAARRAGGVDPSAKSDHRSP